MIPLKMREAIACCKNAFGPLTFKPGTDCNPRSHGIALLGEVVMRVSGQTFEQYWDPDLFQNAVTAAIVDTAQGEIAREKPHAYL